MNKEYVSLEIKDKEYKLRLTTKAMISLEKALGANPLTPFMNIDNGILPRVNEIALCLHACLQAYHHNNDIDKTYELLDEYMKEHSLFEIVAVIVEVYQEAGLLPKEEEKDEKNA